MTPPPVSETAATTAEREARAVEAGQKLLDANAMLRAEILRLRAENDGLTRMLAEWKHDFGLIAADTVSLRAENERLTEERDDAVRILNSAHE